MSASQSAPGPVQHESHAEIAQRARVRNVVNALQHALRAMPLYGHGSPAASRAVESLREAFRQVWSSRDCLTLQFAASGVSVDDEAVAAPTGSNRRESGLEVFQRDGIAAVTFHRGCEMVELQRFLECIIEERSLQGEDDLAIALWNGDFEHIECDLVVTGLDDDEAAETFREAARATTLSPQAGAPDDPPALPEALLTQPLRASELHVSAQEALYLEHLVESELRRAPSRDVMAALMDSLQDGDDTLRDEILLHLETLLLDLLQQNRLHETVALLQELHIFSEAPANLGQACCTAVQRLLGQFNQSPRLAEYLRGIESGEIVAELDALSEFLICLGHTNVASLVRISERVKNKDTATILRQACDAAVTRHPELLLDLLRSEDEVVLRGAMLLVTPGRGEEAVREVVRVLNHPEPRMRLGAAKALVCVGSQMALQALLWALEDDNEEVRQTSAWALATWKYMPALEPIRDILQGPRLRNMVLNEKLTYFDAYARLGGREAVPYLDEVLNARHLFRPRYDKDLRACAARGLGQISCAESQAALRKAVDDRDPKVKRVIQRHLRQGGAA